MYQAGGRTYYARTMPREIVALRLEPELLEALDDAARTQGMTRSALARAALLQVVDRELLRDRATHYLGEDIRERWEQDLAAASARLPGSRVMRVARF